MKETFESLQQQVEDIKADKGARDTCQTRVDSRTQGLKTGDGRNRERMMYYCIGISVSLSMSSLVYQTLYLSRLVFHHCRHRRFIHIAMSQLSSYALTQPSFSSSYPPQFPISISLANYSSTLFPPCPSLRKQNSPNYPPEPPHNYPKSTLQYHQPNHLEQQ